MRYPSIPPSLGLSLRSKCDRRVIRYQTARASAAAWRGFILSLLSRPTREDCADAQTVPPAELRRIMRAAIMHHVNRRALHLTGFPGLIAGKMSVFVSI